MNFTSTGKVLLTEPASCSHLNVLIVFLCNRNLINLFLILPPIRHWKLLVRKLKSCRVKRTAVSGTFCRRCQFSIFCRVQSKMHLWLITLTDPDTDSDLDSKRVADPGLPRWGSDNPWGGAKTYYLAIFCRKLHENERNWTEMGGTPPWRPPTGSANAIPFL